jgi:epoxyqueuosine reductase QueG
VVVSSAADLRAAGFDVERLLPGARSAVTAVCAVPETAAHSEPFWFGTGHRVDSLCYDLTRACEELGHRSLMTVQRSGSHPDPVRDMNPTGFIVGRLPAFAGRTVIANTVVTRALLPAQTRTPAAPPRAAAPAALTVALAEFARALGADLVGVAPVARLDELAAQLRPLFAGQERLEATDRSIRFTPWEPEVTPRPIQVKTAADWLPGARSVLVFGLRYHAAVLRHATQPPAEAVGPYAFQTYVTNWLGAVIGAQLVKRLAALGYRGVITTDLSGTDSFAASPRGPQPDLFANRFAGLAAGLGWLTASGCLATPEFGIRQRVVALVTDAPLEASPLRVPAGAEDRCAECAQPCVTACPSRAFKVERTELVCEGRTYGFLHRDPLRCDWVKRYALMADSGYRYLGSPVDIAPPERITPEALAAALRHHDPIKKYRPVVAEPCVLNCPLAVG